MVIKPLLPVHEYLLLRNNMRSKSKVLGKGIIFILGIELKGSSGVSLYISVYVPCIYNYICAKLVYIYNKQYPVFTFVSIKSLLPLVVVDFSSAK